MIVIRFLYLGREWRFSKTDESLYEEVIGIKTKQPRTIEGILAYDQSIRFIFTNYTQTEHHNKKHLVVDVSFQGANL